MKCCIPLAPLGTAEFKWGKGASASQKWTRLLPNLPENVFSALSASDLCCCITAMFSLLFSCFNYAVKRPETMHRERVRVRVCVEIFNKTDCSTWVGLPVLNELCWGDACPGGLPTISFTWMVTMVLPFLCVCVWCKGWGASFLVYKIKVAAAFNRNKVFFGHVIQTQT